MGLINWFKGKVITELERKIILIEGRIDKLEDLLTSVRARVNNAQTRARKNSLVEEGNPNEETGEGLPSFADLPLTFLKSLSPEELANLKNIYHIK